MRIWWSGDARMKRRTTKTKITYDKKMHRMHFSPIEFPAYMFSFLRRLIFISFYLAQTKCFYVFFSSIRRSNANIRHFGNFSFFFDFMFRDESIHGRVIWYVFSIIISRNIVRSSCRSAGSCFPPEFDFKMKRVERLIAEIYLPILFVFGSDNNSLFFDSAVDFVVWGNFLRDLTCNDSLR